MGAGNDTVVGSAYGDNFNMGVGTNYVDGGANEGTTPWGGKASDTLDVYVTAGATADLTAAAVAGVTVTALDANASGTDKTAYDAGYRTKVVSGSETDYIKNVENVNVQVWNDINGNGQKDWNSDPSKNEVTFGRNIALAVNVGEVQASGDLSNQMHYAWANGTAGNDTFSAAVGTTDISDATLTLMESHKRGVYVELGAGNDTATGSAYGDNFAMGSGTNYVDGGANEGTTPWGAKASDSLDIYVADQTAANAVTVTALDGGGTAEDVAAYDSGKGYTIKVVSGSEVDYVKNIENVNVQIWADKNHDGQRTYTNDPTTNEVSFGRNIALALNVGEIQLDAIDKTKTSWGSKLSDQNQYAWANGTAGNDTFSAAANTTDISSATLKLMLDNKRGVSADMGAGNDTVVGSAYGDNFTMGVGTNYVDGGANEGIDPWGNKAQDVLNIFVTSQAAADAVTVTTLDGTGTAEDIAAYNSGKRYTAKVVSGSEVDYVKNIENVNVQVWVDKNGDGQRNYSSDTNNEVTFARNIPLVVNVNEIHVDPNLTNHILGNSGTSGLLSNQMFFANANGTAGNDTFSAAADTTDISATTLGLMQANQRGVYVNLGAGNDTATGSGYGDTLNMGAGTNYVDGGANTGTSPGGGKAQDTLEIYVADQNASNAVTVTSLDANSTGADATAYGNHYTQKVVSGNETDYVKGIENIAIQIWNDADKNSQVDLGEMSFGRSIQLAINVSEIQVDPNLTNHILGNAGNSGLLSNQMFYAWANGTAVNDTFSAAADTTDIFSATLALMTAYQRGVWVDLKTGNNTAVGSAYGDSFTMGSGINYVDGGANLGTNNGGGKAQDTLDIYVANQAAADAVMVTVLNGQSIGADATAFDNGFVAKVVAGAETDYVKGIEKVNIQIWVDANGNSQRDFPSEITFAKTLTLAGNTAPSFNGGVGPGVAIHAVGLDYAATAGTLLADGKMLSVGYLCLDGSYAYSAVLTRTNANGSLDSTFGGGTGRITVSQNWTGQNYTEPTIDSNGKILLAVGTALDAASDFKLIRLNADGTPDNSFGGTGSIVIPVGAGSVRDTPQQLLLQPDGKIVMAGYSSNGTDNDFSVIRVDSSGTLDTSFGSGGKLVVPVGNAADILNSATLQSDGKIVLAGYSSNGTNYDLSVVRIAADGTLDTTFNSTGKLLLPIGNGDDRATTVIQQSNGKLVLAGRYFNGIDTDAVIVRLDVYGSLDTSFGGTGKVTLHLTGSTDIIYRLAQQADGKILLAGIIGGAGAGGGMSTTVAVLRLNADGTQDAGFGNQGLTTLSLHGIADQVGSIAVQGDGKIVVFGATANDNNFDNSLIIARLNTNGTPDNSLNNQLAGGTAVNASGIVPTVLDPNIAVYDAELAIQGNYAGATLTIARHSGANSEDVFHASGNVSFAGGNLTVFSTVIGTVTQSTGSLTLTFNSQAGQDMVNRAMHGIAYTNSSSTPPNSVTLDWNFSDGNTAMAQGLGGALVAHDSTGVNITTTISEVSLNPLNPAQAADGKPLTDSQYQYFATIAGTAGSELVAAGSVISSATQVLMAQYSHGVSMAMGPGDDTVTGSAYADRFNMGSGTNYVDGGANGGFFGAPAYTARDTLQVVVANNTDAAAVSVVQLSNGMTGADGDAFGKGYLFKVVNAAGNEIDYVKNVENVNIQVWVDANGNGIMDGGETPQYRNIALSTWYQDNVPSPTNTTPALAYAFGSQFADQISGDAALAIFSKTFNASNPFGAYIMALGGNDIITGTAGSDFAMVTQYGSHLVDGGADAGYFSYSGTGSPGISGDQYRLLEQWFTVPDATLANGGLAATDFTSAKYRFVNLQDWTGFATTGLDKLVAADANQLIDKYTSGAISATDVGNIASTALQLGLTGSGGGGYTWAMMKYDGAGALLGVDFLKNIETVQIGLWYDSSRDDIPQSSRGETVLVANYTIAADSYTLAQSDKAWLDLTLSGVTKSYAGLVNGTSFSDLIDLGALTAPAYQTVTTGFRVNGNGGNDSVTGSAGDDFISMGAGNDVINGGAGDDMITGGAGADSIDGGTGSNTVRYAGTAAVTVNLTTNVNSGGQAEGDTLSNIQNIIGSSYNDTLTGDANANIITGGAGADTIDGGAGADTFIMKLGIVPVAQVDTVTLSGKYEAGDQITIIGLATAAVTYTVLAGDIGASDAATDEAVAAKVISAVNSAAGKTVTAATFDAATVDGKLKLTADVAGTAFTASATATQGGAGLDLTQLATRASLTANTAPVTSDSSLTAMDVITGFAIGSDKIDLATAAEGAVAAPTALTRVADVASVDAAGLAAQLQTSFAGIAAGAAGLVVINAGTAAGTYVFANDTVAAFTAADLVVQLVGISGTVGAVGALSVSDYFV